MLKETFYFSHDYNASQDSKILNMMVELGFEGYGLYWALIEKLAEANGKLLLDDLKGLAFAWKIDVAKLICLVSKFNLFISDEQYFWSNRLNEHLEHRNNLSKVRAKMGKIGGLAKAKQMLSNCLPNAKQNVAKERKGKERKEKDSKIKESKNEIILQAKPANEINQIITLFNKINPVINYANKTQRDAVDGLIEKLGFEKLVRTIEYAVSIQGQQYAPTITTPIQLKNKLGDLLVFWKRNNTNRTVKV